MLSRKLSDYLFYGVLVIIVAVVFLIRTVTLGSLNDKIAQLERSNIAIQNQNDIIELQVEEYKDVQINHLYELYGKVPNFYSQSDLTYYTIAQLELVGITEEVDYQRSVYVNDVVVFEAGTEFDKLTDDFKVVEVQVYFNTLDDAVVKDFIDLLYASEQVFIVDSVEYTTPDGFNYIGVTLNFFAFYTLDEEDAS